jgi:CRP-like cAMP-binding protein
MTRLAGHDAPTPGTTMPGEQAARGTRPGRPGADAAVNGLLASLPAAERQRWQARLEPVALPLGKVLHEAGTPLTHGYFPTTAIVSLMRFTESGQSAEIAVTGHEGMVGIELFMGGSSSASRAVVEGAGHGFRLPAGVIRDEFARSTEVTRLLLRYTQALIAQTAQIAVCNRHHAVDQQLCRWLLMRLDRVRGHEIVVTQELIATMLGVRREGITGAALALQKAGVIRYRRGHITVVDATALAARSCECHAVVQAEYRRLLGSPGAP